MTTVEFIEISYRFKSRMHVFYILRYETTELKEVFLTLCWWLFLTLHAFQFASKASSKVLVNNRSKINKFPIIDQKICTTIKIFTRIGYCCFWLATFVEASAKFLSSTHWHPVFSNIASKSTRQLYLKKRHLTCCWNPPCADFSAKRGNAVCRT